MLSIIIPAFNESAVIQRCCRAILDGAQPDELEIIVVCNGCTDNTAELVKSVSEDIKVIETNVPSKSYALNLGDQHATGYPRFYIDADVIVPLDSIRKTAVELNKHNIFAAAPSMKVDCTNRSFWVKSFYQIWLSLPYCHNGMIGSGVYALKEEGRKRFTDFPPLIADDGYIRLLFNSQERLSLQSCQFTVIPPKNLSGIIKIKTRAYYGNLELRHKYPELYINEDTNNLHILKKLFTKSSLWIPLIIYCYVRMISRITAWYRFKYSHNKKWDRDETSR